MPRYASKTDTNHAEIRDGLRRLGFTAIDTFRLGDGKPDLIVIGENRYTGHIEMTWWEIKSKGGSLTKDEANFHNRLMVARHGRPTGIALSIEAILAWYGAIEMDAIRFLGE